MTKGFGLTPEQLEVLRRLVAQRAPELGRLLLKLGREPLTEDEREDLRGVVADEFCERGLRPDSEPNEYGLFLENIIDVLADF